MRELKFRAWSEEHGRYCDFVTLDRDGQWLGWLEIWIENRKSFLTTTDIIIEQYTGLKDKNDNEIYEGDLVSCGTIEGNPVGLVGFSTEFGCWEVLDPNHAFGGENFTEHYCNEMEVVGNIHENSELLNKDQPNEEE